MSPINRVSGRPNCRMDIWFSGASEDELADHIGSSLVSMREKYRQQNPNSNRGEFNQHLWGKGFHVELDDKGAYYLTIQINSEIPLLSKRIVISMYTHHEDPSRHAQEIMDSLKKQLSDFNPQRRK